MSIWFGALGLLAIDPPDLPPIGESAKTGTIIIGEGKPPQVVHRSTENGEFPDVNLSYAISYELRDDHHFFLVSVNGKTFRMYVRRSRFPDLDVGSLSAAPSSRTGDTLLISMRYGDPITDCFEDSEPREVLILSAGTDARPTKWSYDNCESRLLYVNPTDVRIDDYGSR